MKLSQSDANLTLHISHYEDTAVTINQRQYHHNILLSTAEVTSWNIFQLIDLNDNNIEPLFRNNPEIILLGTGNQFQRPPKALVHACATRGIGFEAMSTRSACRSFNILAEEQRNVLAALIIGTPI